MEVVWTQKAEQDYCRQIDNLLERWDETMAEKFVDQVFTTIEYIAQHPAMYPRTSYPKVHKAVINRHISLFYQHDAERIFLLRFWSSRRNPDELKF